MFKQSAKAKGSIATDERNSARDWGLGTGDWGLGTNKKSNLEITKGPFRLLIKLKYWKLLTHSIGTTPFITSH
jgi:hypothetical protein